MTEADYTNAECLHFYISSIAMKLRFVLNKVYQNGKKNLCETSKTYITVGYLSCIVLKSFKYDLYIKWFLVRGDNVMYACVAIDECDQVIFLDETILSVFLLFFCKEKEKWLIYQASPNLSDEQLAAL